MNAAVDHFAYLDVPMRLTREGGGHILHVEGDLAREDMLNGVIERAGALATAGAKARSIIQSLLDGIEADRHGGTIGESAEFELAILRAKEFCSADYPDHDPSCPNAIVQEEGRDV